MIRRVEIATRAVKQLRRVAGHIKDKLMIWVAAVELDGLEATRRVPSYHDELLKGTPRWAAVNSSQPQQPGRLRDQARRRRVSIEEVGKHDH